MIEQLAVAAAAAAVPVSVCGEAASRPLEALVLAALGVTTLSMPASSILPIKAMFAQVRVAVRAALRGAGIGRRLMERGAAIAAERGFAAIVLHAQVSVASFYRQLGYVEEGDVFDEAGIPHITMRKRIG